MAGAVHLIHQRVAGLLKEWMASQLMGLNEETRAIAQGIVDEPVVFIVHGRTISGGRAECEAIDFEGRVKSINCEVMWRQLEDVRGPAVWLDRQSSEHAPDLRKARYGLTRIIC